MRLDKWKQPEIFDPWNILRDIQEETTRFFDVSLDGLRRVKNIVLPAIDVSEDDNTFSIEADIPGFEQKDIRVTFKDDMLFISARRQESREEKKGRVHRMERFSGAYERVIPFAKKVEADKIKAQYKNGVLNIILPKAAQEKNKEITVSVG